MADVFLSYARPSAAVANAVAVRLRERGWSVWFDDELPPDRLYADVIAAELEAARAVLVLWSADAVRSQWVRSEADRARNLNRLVQLRLDGAALPMPFDQIQCADLAGWDGQANPPRWASILNSLQRLIDTGGQPTEAPANPGAPGPPRIIILPLKRLSADPADDYLGEGLAEEIVTTLSRLPGVRVAAGERGRIEDRGTAAILDGSVQRSGSNARINIRLVDPHSGVALWSERFDRSLADVFAVQEEIARAVTAALGITLLDRDGRVVRTGGSSDPKANDLVLKARHLARQELEVERRAAADFYRMALRRDPDFALAHAGLADVLAQLARWHLAGWQADAIEAETSARRAVELAPDLADSHLALGAALHLRHDPQAAEAYARALALAPEDPNVHYRFARYLALENDKAGAVRHYEQAFALAPDDYRYIVYALQEYQALGDAKGERSCLERSAHAIERHLQGNPGDVRALGHGAGVLALLGRKQEALAWVARAERLRPHDPVNLNTLACAAMLMSEPEQALDYLEQSFAQGDGDREWLATDNDLKPLHGHPRFEAILHGADALT